MSDPVGRIHQKTSGTALAALFVVLSLVITGACFFFFHQQANQIRKSKQEALAVIGQLKRDEITGWRKERIADAKVLMHNYPAVRLIQSWFENPDMPGVEKGLRMWFEQRIIQHDYFALFLLDAAGHVRMTVAPENQPMGAHAMDLFARATKQHAPVFSEIHKSDPEGNPHIGLMVPFFFTAEDGEKPVGAILLLIDLEKYLYPLIQQWPTSSFSAESLLVCRDGDDVLFLNELRHRKNTALNLRFPVGQSNLPAAMTVQGVEGIVEGVDYRGVKVLSAVYAIPDSPWFIVAKEDSAEIFAGIRQQAIIIGVVAFGFIMASGAGLAFFRRRQTSRFYHHLALDLEERVQERTAQLEATLELNRKAQKELEQHRYHLEEIVKERTNELKKAVTELERSNHELEQFAYVASHDLQEPLRMVSSYTQLLAERYKDQLDEKAEKYIHYAVDGAIRMQQLINDLLAYSRINTRGEPFEAVDTHEILGRALSNLSAVIEQRHAVVTNENLSRVKGDATQLMQVFQNIIANAVKFNDSQIPQIHIAAREKDNEWVFSIKDNGIGIDPEYKEKIFVIFQRLHTRQEYSGTGIGLAICKRIIERHGGRIWFESEPGKGATFFFTLLRG